jgi:hypothetical protein
MKLKTTALALLALCASTAYTGLVFAQACPGTLTGAVPAAGGTVTGNNCNNNTNFTKICANGDTLGGGGMDIWSMPIGASYSGITINITSTDATTFVPLLGVIGSPCSSSTTCIIDFTPPSGATTGAQAFPSGQPAGTYYIFVANSTDAGCGNYNLAVNGTLPVKLQKFSVR